MGDSFEEMPDNYRNALERYFFDRYQFQRASGKTYQRFNINTFELDMLCMLVAHCARHGKYIVSKHHFFSEMTGNGRRKAKYEGYLLGLRNAGYVGSYEYTGYAGSLSIGVSQLGWTVLKYFYKCLHDLVNAKEQKGHVWTVILPSDDFETKSQKLLSA
jgi:hypothetical protein